MTELLPAIPGVQLLPNAAVFQDGIDIKAWADAGRLIVGCNQASQWWVGDWVNHGERSFQRNKEAIAFFGKEILGEQHGYELKTIQNYAYVCRKVKPSLRKEGLSFQHHMEVAQLDGKDQSIWLQKALTGTNGKRWTVAELREQIRAANKTVEEGSIPNPCPTITKYMTEAVCWLGREDGKAPIETWDKERCGLVLLSIQRIEPFRKRIIDRLELLK
jgi:hypothetical protein